MRTPDRGGLEYKDPADILDAIAIALGYSSAISAHECR